MDIIEQRMAAAEALADLAGHSKDPVHRRKFVNCYIEVKAIEDRLDTLESVTVAGGHLVLVKIPEGNWMDVESEPARVYTKEQVADMIYMHGE